MYRVFDELNRVVEVHDATGGVTEYTYDLFGNRLTVTDAEDQTTTFVYDDIGDLVEVQDPTVESPDRVVTLEYDEAGNVIRKVDRRQVEAKYIYDPVNRLVEEQFPADPTLNTQYVYDHRSDLVEVDGYAVEYTMGYDEKHRLISRQDERSTGIRTSSWTYNALDNIETKTNYAGQTTRYLYDATNRIVSLQNPEYVSVSYHYDPAGRLLNRILSNGAQTHYQYDAANRLVGLENSTVTDLVESYTYARDRVGNLVSITGDYDADFTYDALHRLRRVIYTAADVLNRCYTYDGVGNRLTETWGSTVENCLDASPPPPSLSYDYSPEGNRLLKIRQGTSPTQLWRFEYDEAGNLKFRRNGADSIVQTLAYDRRGRLRVLLEGGSVRTFEYDPMGYRVEQGVSGGPTKRYFLEGEHLELVENGSGDVTATFLRGVVIDEVVNGYLETSPGAPLENLTWLHDPVQSVTATADHGGAESFRDIYLPFGEPILGPEDANFLRYTGRELDQTGLYYYRARYYDPTIGRFLQEDPLGFAGGDVNFYAYAGNNPLNSNDPRGLTEQHTDLSGVQRVARELADIVGVEVSLGAQVEVSADVGGYVTLGVTIDAGTDRQGFTNTGPYGSVTRGVSGEIFVGIPKTPFAIGVDGGYGRQLDYLPHPDSNRQYLLERFGTPEAYAGVQVGPFSRNVGARIATNDTDVRVGLGVAFGLGVSADINLSEVYDAGSQAVDYVTSRFQSAGASGGFVLYPGRPNLNGAFAGYSK